ncbi:MAG TPA: family 43 glycosylhydrolase [Mucilaginibacter sp.]|jgi:beta-xylosidase
MKRLLILLLNGTLLVSCSKEHLVVNTPPVQDSSKISSASGGVATSITSPSAGNPIFPGYFGDPSTLIDDGNYYIYSTTDGYDMGQFTNGPFGVWQTSDFINWNFTALNYPSNFPYTSTKLWALSVIKASNGRYYMYYIKDGYNCFVVSATTPKGPWVAENQGNPIYANMFDAEAFRDDDGSIYLIYMGPKVNNQCAVYLGKLNLNMTSFSATPQLIYQNYDLFEAPYVFKRNATYYLTYANGSLSGTYNVSAAYASAVGGPYTPHNITGQAYSPILGPDYTNNMIATGSNSIFKINNNYYIAYHRKAYPFRSSDLFRQVCIDQLSFDSNGRLIPISPSVNGVNPLVTMNTAVDLAYLKTTTASSQIDNTNYKASYATDHNNGTLWKAGSNIYPQYIIVDLGSTVTVNNTVTAFEYFTEAYQYKIEYSQEGNSWTTYVDKTTNQVLSGPLTDTKNVQARYMKLTITGSTKTNQAPGVWSFSVY